MPTFEDLQKAEQYLLTTLEHLKTNGWIKDHAISPAGCCLSHALYVNESSSIKFTPFQRTIAQNAIYDALDASNFLGIPRWGIIAFNDHPETTFADIENLFSRAIENLHSRPEWISK